MTQLRAPSDSEFLDVAQTSFDNFIEESARSSGESASVLKEKFGGPPTHRSENDVWLLVEHEGQRVGFVWFQLHPNEKSAFGWDIYLDPEFRSQGIGRSVMNQCADELRTRGVTSAKICVFEHNHIARGLYESLGFVVESFDEKRRQFTLILNLQI